MPTQLDPPATFPVVWVTVTWPGASAEDMEALVTNPIEQQLRTVNQLKELNSRTQAGQMRISVTFEHDADLTMGLDDVKQRVANIRNMPQDIEPPEIRPLIDMEPISVLLVSGSGTISDLIPVVRKLERSAMASGVDGVFFSGPPDRGDRVDDRRSPTRRSRHDAARDCRADSAGKPQRSCR